MPRFPARMFRWAAIYGVLVLAPLYLLPLPALRPEEHLGFIGLALAWQAAFWAIGGDPVRHRPLMLAGAAEKLAFGLPAVVLFAIGRIAATPAVFGAIDLALAAGFVLAWRATPRAS